MITIDLHGDDELIKGIQLMRKLGFLEEEIQNKYDEQIRLDKESEAE